MYTLYERLKNECEKHGETLYGMCRKLGISKGVMTNLKSGISKSLSVSTLNKFADALGVSINYLANGTNDEIEPKNGEIDEFAYALYNETKGLTADQKALILQLAKQMNAKD